MNLNSIQLQYLALLNILMLRRGVEILTDEQEGEYVEQFDALWYKLTTEEQAELEEILQALPAPTAPDDLGLVDTVTQVGESKMHREPKS